LCFWIADKKVICPASPNKYKPLPPADAIVAPAKPTEDKKKLAEGATSKELLQRENQLIRLILLYLISQMSRISEICEILTRQH